MQSWAERLRQVIRIAEIVNQIYYRNNSVAPGPNCKFMNNRLGDSDRFAVGFESRTGRVPRAEYS